MAIRNAPLTITHTHKSGTLCEGTSRGDGTAAILKAAGWRWSRNLGVWYVPRSRDVLAKRDVIDRTVRVLREAGFDVAVAIDDTPRPMAAVEASRIEQADARADALHAKAERAEATADARWAQEDAAVGRLPGDGQPILVGHHSEGRHRRDIARAHEATRRALDADAHAEDLAARARIARQATDRRYNPVTVGNRIATLEASLRRVGRHLEECGPGPARERLALDAKRLDDEVGYWTRVRADQLAVGAATGYSREGVGRGDFVRIRGYWYEVVRANAKSVTVRTGQGWDGRSPWCEVQDHRAASVEMPGEASASSR